MKRSGGDDEYTLVDMRSQNASGETDTNATWNSSSPEKKEEQVGITNQTHPGAPPTRAIQLFTGELMRMSTFNCASLVRWLHANVFQLLTVLLYSYINYSVHDSVQNEY